MLQSVNQNGIKSEAAMDAYAAKFLADRAYPSVSAQVRVDKSYGINSLRPGQTVSLQGIDFLPYRMVISKIRYAYDFADLTMDTIPIGLSSSIADLYRAVGDLGKANSPDSFSIV
jgi:hypothetical protein